MNYPKITLITPSYNQGNFLEQTILSVLGQQYPNLEYMVVDGGSSDQSVEIINRYKKDITWSVSEKDRGQAHAINKGIEKATGDIISWINSDDYLHEKALFSIAENFADPSVNCVIGKIEYFNDDGPVRRSRNVVKSPAEKTMGSGVVPQPAMYFRKACYDKIGLLNEKLNLYFDSEWYMRYLVHYGTKQIREIDNLLVHFRFHRHSKTISQGERFNLERASIWYSIATQCDILPLKNLLEQTYAVDKSYQFVIPENPLGIGIEKAINYFTLLIANEYYELSMHEKAAICFNLVKPSLLDADSRVVFNKLKFRNTFIPGRLIKMLRLSRK